MAREKPLTGQALEDEIKRISGDASIFKAIRSPRDLDGIAIGVNLFAKRTTDPTEKFDTFVYHGNNRFLNITNGKLYELRELLGEFGKGAIGVVDKQVVERIKNDTLRRQADTNLKRITLDIETSMAGDHAKTLERTYSLGIARHFDNTRVQTNTGKTVAVFRHRANGKSRLLSGSALYDDTRSHMAKARMTIGEASTVAQMHGALDELHKHGILTEGDSTYIRQHAGIDWKGSTATIKKDIHRYLALKEQALKSEVSGYIKYAGESAGKSVYQDIGLRDSSKFSSEFFDRKMFDEFADEYLQGSFTVQDRMFGKEGYKHTLRHSGLEFLKKQIGHGTVTRDEALGLARDFYQGVYRRRERLQSGKTVDEIMKSNLDRLENLQKQEGTNLIIDMRGNFKDNKDLQHLTQILFQKRHEIMGNHGSTTETGFHGDAMSFVQKNIDKNQNPSYLQDLLSNKVKDSLGSMVDDLSRLTSGHHHKDIVDHEKVKKSFYELYGSNANFARRTGLNVTEVKDVIHEATDLIYDKYGGNKTVQNLMNMMHILAKEPHRAGPDAAYDARAASMMANDLRELEEIRNKPRLTQYDEYRMRELGLKYSNAIFAQLVLKKANKSDFQMRPEDAEKQSRRIIRDLWTDAKRRNGINPERRERLMHVAQSQIEAEIRTTRHHPKRMGFMFEEPGVSNWKQFFGGAALFAGVAEAANRITNTVRSSPFVTKTEDGQDRVVGLSHNSIQTMIDRINNTDFGSGLKPGNFATLRTIWKVFQKSLDDTKNGQRVKRMMSNINKRMRQPNKNIFARTRLAAKEALLGTGRIVGSHNLKLGRKMIKAAKSKTTVLDLVKDTFVKPLNDIRTGKTPLTKIVPSILHNKVGRVAIAAGAITGIGLYAVTGRSIRDRGEELNKKASDYTKKNRIGSSNPWPKSNADMLAEMLNAKRDGIEHGGMQRQLNRMEMTDFRSALTMGVGKVSAGVAAIGMDAGKVARKAGAAKLSAATFEAGSAPGNPIAGIEKRLADFDASFEAAVRKGIEESPTNPTRFFEARVPGGKTGINKPHKWGHVEQSAINWRPESSGYANPNSAAAKLTRAREAAVAEARKAFARTKRTRLFKPDEVVVDGRVNTPRGVQRTANDDMHLGMAKGAPQQMRMQHINRIPPAIGPSLEAQESRAVVHAVGKGQTMRGGRPASPNIERELASMDSATAGAGRATEMRRPINQVPSGLGYPRTLHRFRGQDLQLKSRVRGANARIAADNQLYRVQMSETGSNQL